MKRRFSVSSLLRAALLSVAALSPFSSQGANLELRASTPLATPGEVVTIDGGEWLAGAGQFNFASMLADEDWEKVKKY